jgi:hypothetical protein
VLACQTGRAILSVAEGHGIARADRHGDVCEQKLRMWLASI